MKLLPVILALALAAGCASIEYCEEGGRHMVVATNSAWYFLNVIPIASGNPDAPNSCSCKILRRTTTLRNNMKLLARACAEHGAVGVKDVNSHWSDESMLLILFKRHSYHTSAELVMPPAPEDTKEDDKCE